MRAFFMAIGLTLTSCGGALLFWLVLLLGATAALADAKQDCEKLSGDAAISACDQAIRQNPRDATAYYNRGVEYNAKGDLDRALADYNKAIELDPKYALAYNNRGNAYRDKGDLDRAMANYNKAIELDPKDSLYVRQLGVAKYDKGDFKGAAVDLLRAIELEDDIYAMLFRYLARTRAGEAAEAELEANAGRLKTKDWPYAVMELYLGKRSPAATLDAASKPDDRCYAQFYIGQWHVLKGNAAEARTALKAAADICRYTSAVAELKRLRP